MNPFQKRLINLLEKDGFTENGPLSLIVGLLRHCFRIHMNYEVARRQLK